MEHNKDVVFVWKNGVKCHIPHLIGVVFLNDAMNFKVVKDLLGLKQTIFI